jgi:hypothetical protein
MGSDSRLGALIQRLQYPWRYVPNICWSLVSSGQTASRLLSFFLRVENRHEKTHDFNLNTYIRNRVEIRDI